MAKYDSDVSLYDKWREDPSKKNFQNIYKAFKPLLNSAMSKASYGSTLPRSAFVLQAAQQFKNSLETYDPKYGVQLKTFIYGSVQDKVKRLNAKYANVARQPERSGGDLGVYNINEFYNTKELLSQKYNREPSATEMARAMNVTPEKITQFEQEVKRDLSLNQELEDLVTFQDISGDEAEIAMHYYDMTPRQQLVFDYATGRHGKKAQVKASGLVDWNAVSRSTRMPLSEVQKIRKQITRKLGR